MDNSYIIPWLLFLDFQVTKSNKARFMIFFLINILNIQISIIFLRVIFFFSQIQSLFTSKNKFQILFCFVFYFLIFLLFFLIHVVLNYFFVREFPWGFEALDQKFFSQKNFLKFIFTHFVLIEWNSVSPPSFSKTKIQFLRKFIYFYCLMFSNLGCS